MSHVGRLKILLYQILQMPSSTIDERRIEGVCKRSCCAGNTAAAEAIMTMGLKKLRPARSAYPLFSFRKMQNNRRQKQK